MVFPLLLLASLCAIVAIALLIATVFTILYIAEKKSFDYWKKRGFPYLEPCFPFGNLRDMLLLKRSMGQAYADCYEKLDAPVAGVFFLQQPVLVLKDPEVIKASLVKDFEHFHDRGLAFDEKIDPVIGNLFMLTGKKWKDLRADLTKTFTSGKMKRMFHMAAQCGEELADFLKAKADAEDMIEVKEIMANFTTDIIASCAFGVHCNCLRNPDAEFRRIGKRMVELTLWEQFIGLLYLLVPGVALRLRLPLTTPCVARFFRRVVKEILEFRRNSHTKRDDFIQLLLELREQLQAEENKPGLSLDEMTAQVMVFFTGGFETSSTAMSLCLYELAMNPGIQDRLRQEMTSVLERHDGVLTYEGVSEMKYLDQVVSETLRKYPPVSLLNRECTKDFVVPGTGLKVERGTKVVIPVLGLHSDPQHYPNPHAFDPDRFTSENVESRHRYAYLPFGEGPRVCIGMRFGLMQTKVGLVSLLRRYKFQPCERTSIPPVMNPRLFITSPKGGIHLRISHAL